MNEYEDYLNGRITALRITLTALAHHGNDLAARALLEDDVKQIRRSEGQRGAIWLNPARPARRSPAPTGSGGRVKQARLDLGIPRSTAARLLGCSPNLLTKIEEGLRAIPLARQDDFRRVFGAEVAP